MRVGEFWRVWGRWGLVFLGVGWGCRRAPGWLSQAPLIGYRYTDDAGVQGYIPQPPRRVAVLSPAALSLWKAANLPTITLNGCTGEGEGYETFYLPCEDPSALIEALYKARVEWIWADPSYPWPEIPRPPAPFYHFYPESISDWLKRLSFLGEIYDVPALHQVADSLRREVEALTQRLARERRFKVLLLGFEDSLLLYTDNHPLGQMTRAAGGTPPSAPTPFIAPQTLKDFAFLPDIIIVPSEKPEIINTLLLEVPELYTSPALLHKRIFSMPRILLKAPYSSPLESFYTLVRVLHPEAISLEAAPPSPTPN